jgi:hypothetical protein
LLSGCAGAGNQEETVVVKDISAIARRTLGAIADPHANGRLFVGGITAPVGFPANSAWSIFSNSTKAIDRNSLSLRKVDDPVSANIGNIYRHFSSLLSPQVSTLAMDSKLLCWMTDFHLSTWSNMSTILASA